MRNDIDISDFIQKARESLEVAEDLFKSKHYDFSASRAYYAMFYSAETVLLTKDLSFSTHKAVISSFGKEFIKTKLFPSKLHKYIRDAFKLRQLGDYGSPGSISKEKSQILIEQAKEFIDTIEEYLRSKGYNL